MEKGEKQTDRLRMSQQILAESFESMNHSALSAQSMSDTLKQTSSVYSKYGDKIGISKKLVHLIETQEKREELLFKVSMYMFFFTAAFLFFKRFFLLEILRFLVYVLFELVLKNIFGVLQFVFRFRIGFKQIYEMVREEC